MFFAGFLFRIIDLVGVAAISKHMHHSLIEKKRFKKILFCFEVFLFCFEIFFYFEIFYFVLNCIFYFISNIYSEKKILNNKMKKTITISK